MARLYLITGFLGAGKTTFVTRLTACFAGSRLALVVNDFGRERVDAALMADQGFVLREVNNGSIFCACRAEQFSEALAAVLAGGPDVILVEASGLADPTGIRSILADPALASLEYAGALCLVDAARFHKVRDTALVSRHQLAAADGVVVNKTDLATAEQLAAVRADIAALCPGAPVLETSFGAVTPEWIAGLTRKERQETAAAPHTRDLTLQKLTLEIGAGITREELEGLLSAFAGDAYRVKGFVSLSGGVVLVDCVGCAIQLSPWAGESADLDRLTVLFGNGLPARASLRRALADHPTCHILQNGDK